LQWLGRQAGIHAWFLYILNNAGPMQQDHIIGNSLVIQNTCLSAGNDTIPDARTPGHAEHGRQQTIFANLHVVSYMTKVIKLGPGPDTSFLVGCSINAAVGSHKYSIFENHAASLGNAMALFL